ncbi:MAG: hypothetical protein AB7T31_17605 [Gemmatimonadales bacterium]
MSPPPAGPPPLASLRLGQPASRRERWSSFGISVALHAVLVVGLLAIVPLRADLPLFQQAYSERGIEVWLPPAPEPPPPEPAPVVPAAPEGVGVGVAGAIELVQPNVGDFRSTGDGIVLPPIGGTGTYGDTPAERLQPGFSDPRIWGPLPEQYRTLSPEQREEISIATRFQAWNDSIAAAAAAEAAMRDWTFTDGDGDRWGVSDGQLHLGGLTLPLPFNIQGSAAQRDYLRSFDEMARQGANALIQQSVRERQEAIRARRDAERAAAPRDTTQTQR